MEKHDDNSNLWKDYVDNCEDIDCSDIEDLEDLDCEYKHKSHCVKICKIPGPRGPQGEPGASIDCLCVTQIRNILRQMMCLFPKSKILINYENGGSVAGIPVELYPESSNEGVVKLADDSGTITDRINICKIAAITLTGHCDETLYNEDGSIKLEFFTLDEQLLKGNAYKCEYAVRNTLIVLGRGKKMIQIIAGGYSQVLLRQLISE